MSPLTSGRVRMRTLSCPKSTYGARMVLGPAEAAAALRRMPAMAAIPRSR
jgi:hypothetical protein